MTINDLVPGLCIDTSKPFMFGNNNISPIKREHVWKANADGCGTDICKYCNSRVGIGFISIVHCNARFNDEGFQSWLDFKNLSIDGDIVRRRLSDETMTLLEAKHQFITACDADAFNKVIGFQLYHVNTFDYFYSIIILK